MQYGHYPVDLQTKHQFRHSIFRVPCEEIPHNNDDQFKWANKYSMLEDDIRVASQQVLVTNQLAKHDKTRSFMPSNQTRQSSGRQDNKKQ